MPGYGDENHPLTSSKKLGLRLRRLSMSSKRRSDLKATISGPRAFDGGGVSTTTLGDLTLRTLNGFQVLPLDSSSNPFDGPSPPQQTVARDPRRNSDIPPRHHHSNSAWPTNHPTMTHTQGSHHTHRAGNKKHHKGYISGPLAPDLPRISSTPEVSSKRPRRSAQFNRRSSFSGIAVPGILKGNPDDITSQGVSLSEKRLGGSNTLSTPSSEFDPQTMMESFPALGTEINMGAASFGSVKERSRKIDKSLRKSRIMTPPVPLEEQKPDLVYTDDSDTPSSLPSTPSPPAWESIATSPSPETDPKLANELELADVHVQIQTMIDSVKTGFDDFLAQDQRSSGVHRNKVPPLLRPNNPMYRLSTRLAITHRRSASSPPLGSGDLYAYPPDFKNKLYRPTTPVAEDCSASHANSPSKLTTASPKSTTSADPMALTTPTRQPPSEVSDIPSIHPQRCPSSQIDDTAPTSSTSSSPDHPFAKNRHERLLAALSEGILSPTKPGPPVISALGSGRGRNNKMGSVDSPPHANVPTVPVIVVTDPNEDDLVYSESGFSIVDMYSGSAGGGEGGQRRRRACTTNTPQPRQSLGTPTLRSSVSFNSPRLSQIAWELPQPSNESPKRRVSIFRPGLPSSFLSMSTLHEVEAAERTNTQKDRKSFYAAVGLKGLFRRSTSKGSLAQAQANGTADATGSDCETRPGSTSLAAPGTEAGDVSSSKGGWGLFKWRR